MSGSSEGGESYRFRRLGKGMGVVQKALLVAAPAIGMLYTLNVHVYLGLPGLWTEQYIGLFLALVLASVFLGVPPRKRASLTKVPWYDFVLVLASFVVGGYVAIFYPREMLGGLRVTLANVVLGSILVLVALEAARRLLGWVFVGLTSFFILYGAYTYFFPGFLWGKGTAWPRLITHLYLDSTSFLWMVGVAAALVLTFILFGQAVFSFGGGKVFGDIALSTMGRFRGGAAKVSVLGSSLFGTVSGSAVSNILVIGSITIPLMKRTGYRSHVAGAIEAAASTGGMIMPPVMGVVAFIMADMIGVPYSDVAVAAFIPAALYYIALFIQVDLEAAQQGLRGLPREELPPLMPVLKKSWTVVLPLAFLIYTLFIVRLPPATAAAYSTIFGFLIFPCMKDNRTGYWQRFLSVFKDSGGVLMTVGALLICAGFIVAVVGISGLGSKIAVGLATLGGGNVFALLAIAAVSAIVLGMGLPASACYILVAVLIAPALVSLGIPLISAHLFVLYYANLALITPPVALAVFVAAPLAGADTMQTGWYAMRLAILAYIVPFLFVFSPPLLMQGPVWSIATEVLIAIIGAFALGAGLSGYLFHRLPWYRQMLTILAALALLISTAMQLIPLGLSFKLLGLLIIVPLAIWDWKYGYARLEAKMIKAR